MNTASLHTEPLKGKSFTLDDFQAIFGTPDGSPGTGVIPNPTPIKAEDMLYHLSNWGTDGIRGRCFNPAIDNRSYQGWCTYWLATTQSGRYNGNGWVVVGRQAYSFALCNHEIQRLPTANPLRGFHDQFCIHCGMDLSYDSSD